jgi:hypothetical protein
VKQKEIKGLVLLIFGNYGCSYDDIIIGIIIFKTMRPYSGLPGLAGERNPDK